MKKGYTIIDVLIVIVVVVILAAIAGGFVCFDRYKCKRSAAIMGVDYKYDAIGGCYVKYGDRYVPEGYYNLKRR